MAGLSRYCVTCGKQIPEPAVREDGELVKRSEKHCAACGTVNLYRHFVPTERAQLRIQAFQQARGLDRWESDDGTWLVMAGEGDPAIRRRVKISAPPAEPSFRIGPRAPEPLVQDEDDEGDSTATLKPGPVEGDELYRPSPRRFSARLIRSSPLGDPARLELERGTSLVGSGKRCDLVITSPDRSVSRRHAEIRCDVSGQGQPHVWVRDVGSLNGTFVNGEKLTGEQLLKEGDVVTFADVSYLLRVEQW